MDILEIIKARRSIRRYKPEPVFEEEIEKILEAGRWAPSAKNSQPWRFIVLRSKEVRKNLQKRYLLVRGNSFLMLP